MAEVVETQFDSDQFLKLLTEALRAGPGSPEWHEAVNQLKTTTLADADEFRMLVNAREHLESGRDYRSIRAGAGFTKKVMAAIDEESAVASQSAAPPSATMIAILAGGLILAVIIVVGVIWYRGGPPPQPTASELQNTVFAQTIISSDFAQLPNMPAEWRTFGLVPEKASKDRGLRAGVQKEDKEYRGGGIYSASGLPPAQAFAFEANIRQIRPSEQVAVQLFVTDAPQFDQNPKASTPHELVCYLLEGKFNVAKPDGSIQGGGLKAKDVNHIAIKVDKQFVVVEADGQTLYIGPHDLAQDKARYVGVRFLSKSSDKPVEDVTVVSVKISKP